MATTPIELVSDVQQQSSQVPAPSAESQVPAPPVLDEFGRDASERTVELSSRDAEAVNVEVVQGKHQTYDDALAYVLQRGFAEIKRQRDAARVALEKTVLKNKKDSYSRLLSSNPSLVTNSEFVATMMKDLGLTK